MTKKKTTPPGEGRGDKMNIESVTAKNTLPQNEAAVHPKVAGPAAGFFELFAGLDRAYSQFRITGKRGDKVEGEVALIKKPATEAHWRAHLAGELGIGIIPIRDDATCVFGALDVDEYDLDLKDLNGRIRARGLPLVLCRSKSGGAHLFLFMSEPAPAELMRSRLAEMAVALDRPGVEVFPKQVRLASDRDFGALLNMPYFGGTKTDRYALDPKTGKKITDPVAFLKIADRMAVTVADLEGLVLGEDEFFPGGPPCLQILARTGFAEGSRNNALYDVAVYLKKRHGEEGWDAKLSKINHELMKPSLEPKEVTGIGKSVKRKSYEFKCLEQPICGACNREVCLTREFGIKGASDDPGVTFGQLTKISTDPPLYIWDVNGKRLELTSTQIMDQRKFHQVCFESLDDWPNLIRPQAWKALVKERLGTIETQGAPDEASRGGRLLAMLEEFFITRSHGLTRDELLLKKPWTDKGWTYFRVSDFMQYLDQQRVRGFSERQIWMTLRRNGGRHGQWHLKKTCLKWWAMPEVPILDDDLPTPRVGEEKL